MAEVRKVVTIVFSDVVGSTRLGERLDPELLRAVMSRYFDAMQGTLERHGGTVEKFIGDAIMAVFGLPTLHEDDALRAVRAAVDMRAALVELNAELEQDHGVRIEMRTGVNTGEVVTGDAVTAQKLATGDAVNVAARLEQAAGAGEILIGEATHRLVAGSVRAEPLEALELAGKTDVVQAWRVHEVLPDTARPTATPLVGREGELALLTTAFELARSERACKLTTVVGPPGIGKSRLTRELTETVAARVAVGRCLAYGEAITYAALVEIVEQLGDVEQRLAHEDDGAAIWDRISVALGSSSQRVSPEEIAWAFRKLFEAVGRDQPLVVVVDDIHWGEPTLLDLLEYVVGFASGAPILLVCLARPDLFDSRPSWAAPRPNASVVSLDPLTDDETRNLIARLEHTSALINVTASWRPPKAIRSSSSRFSRCRPKLRTRSSACRRRSRRCCLRGSTGSRQRSATCSRARPSRSGCSIAERSRSCSRTTTARSWAPPSCRSCARSCSVPTGRSSPATTASASATC